MLTLSECIPRVIIYLSTSPARLVKALARPGFCAGPAKLPRPRNAAELRESGVQYTSPILPAGEGMRPTKVAHQEPGEK